MNELGILVATQCIVGVLAAVWMGYRMGLREKTLLPHRDPVPDARMVFKTDEEEAKLEETTSPGIEAIKVQYEQTVGKAIDNGLHEVE